MRNCVISIASLALLAACGADPGPRRVESGFRTTYAAPVAEEAQVAAGAVFTDVTDASGIGFVHVTGAGGRKYLPETMGSGVALFDHDGDDDLDVLFVQSRPWESASPPTMRLYRNEGALRFTDVTQEAGLALPCYGMGAAAADPDADGDLDLYVTCLGPDLFLRNEGGRFVRLAGAPDGGSWTDEQGRTHASWSTGAAWFDAEGDGDLDLVVVAYVRWTPERDVYASVVEGVKAYTRPQFYEGTTPHLYLQEEDGSFRDATEGSGLDRAAVKGKSLAVCVDDFDGDGRPDLFVANDTVQNFLFLNRGEARFEEVAVSAGVAYDDTGLARASMGVDAVDYRNDGRIAIAIGNFSEEPVTLFTRVDTVGGAVLFADDANRARIGHPTLLPLTFGLRFLDVDLDGWCDLVLANGHIEPSVTQLKRELRYEQRPQVFRNIAGTRFVDVSDVAGAPFAQRLVGRGLAAGDLDGDGDLDLVLTANGGRPKVLRCDLQSGCRALRLRLRQPGTRNPDSLGAVATVTTGDLTQRRVVRTGGSYLSHSELTLTFGLGTASRADQVHVRWPDGTEEDFGPLAAGLHLLQRGG